MKSLKTLQQHRFTKLSEERDRLEDYVRKLGGRKMSVSGLLENIARQHLDTYDADFEQWRKL